MFLDNFNDDLVELRAKIESLKLAIATGNDSYFHGDKDELINQLIELTLFILNIPEYKTDTTVISLIQDQISLA